MKLERSFGDVDGIFHTHAEQFEEQVGHLARLNHWPRKVSTPARRRTRMAMGNQNSTPLRSRSTSPLSEKLGVHSMTLATFLRVMSWAGESSSMEDSEGSGWAANFKLSGGSAMLTS